MPDRDLPLLVVANTNTELEQRRHDEEWAEQEVDWTLRQLAANLLRVVRGAGKPYDIAENVQAFIQALAKYRDATGHLTVMDQFSTMLSSGQRDYLDRGLKGANLEEARAQKKAIRGALQVVASRLLGQATQRSAGEDELSEGARRLVKAYAEQTQEWDLKAREAAKAAKPKRAAKKQS